MSIRFETLTIDARDPAAIARFWQQVLGGTTTVDDDGDVTLQAPDAPELLFQRVPDDKAVKNRFHFDLRPDDRDAEVARLEGLGARRVDIGQGDTTWVVMADPEGNEFCVLRALS